MALPEAKGRETLAGKLAKQGLSVEAAKDVLESSPRSTSLAARAGAGIPELGHEGAQTTDWDRAKIDATWSGIVAKENKARGYA